MPLADCCGKELKDCSCSEREEERKRKRKEESEERRAAKDAPEAPPVWALSMQENLLKGLKGVIKEELKPMREDLEKVKKSVAVVEDRVSQVEAKIEDKKSDDQKLKQQIQDIEKKLSEVGSTFPDDSTTVLFGGFQGKTFEEAETWVKAKIKEKSMEEPSVVYFKGDDFAGFVFAKFSSTKVAEEIARKISISLKLAEENIWCKKDLPLDRRVALSALLGLRRQLIEWGYAKSKIRVKDEDSTLLVSGSSVLKAVVKDHRLELDWLSPEWRDWKELTDSIEVGTLIKKAEETLKKAAENKGKGEGKGKKGQ